MTRPLRFGLLTQLLTGFAGGGLFVALLLGFGDRMLQQSSAHLVTTLENHVRPLAALHQLQSSLTTLRNRELELSTQKDVFGMQTQVGAMRSTLREIDSAIHALTTQINAGAPGNSVRLERHWSSYRSHLTRQIQSASDMDLRGLTQTNPLMSQQSFLAVQATLADAALATEKSADNAYQATMRLQEGQRRGFFALVMLGSVILAAGLAWSGRTVVRRIKMLRDHADKLAHGQNNDGAGDIAVGGQDEITELAQVFQSMRNQVLHREAALQLARLNLEDRVQARTADLQNANNQLVLFSHVFEQSPVGILLTSLKGQIEFANPAFSRIMGVAPETLQRRSLEELLCGSDLSSAMPMIQRVLGTGHPWEFERRSRRISDSTEYWERMRLISVKDEQGQASHFLLSCEDITLAREQQEKIAYQANYDALTALPNRVLAQYRLGQVIGRARRDGSKAAVMFIDLDHFKQINDTLGHDAGDLLLQQAAERLRAAVRHEDTVARLGGDEFLIIVGDLSHGDDASGVAEQILQAFKPIFSIQERDLICSPSIGIAVYPDDGLDATVLQRNADLAMYEAKEGGRATFRFFNQAIHDVSLQRLEIGRRLRGALERGELSLVFHPLVSAISGCVVGSEALLRWHHPELGEIMPDTFIPIAEQNGLIVDIGNWVLREACAVAARWSDKHAGFVMAVNVSPRQFRAKGFVDTVRRCIAEFHLAPNQLEIEITEGLLLGNQSDVRELIQQLHQTGVRLSMDDFGTGYSSLSYLREFPFHTIKIDKSFIRDVSDDRSDRALVVAAVRMAQAMGLQIIAEGVETDEQWSFLAEQDCDVLQGYRFGKPITGAEFDSVWLNASIPLPTLKSKGEAILAKV